MDGREKGGYMLQLVLVPLPAALRPMAGKEKHLRRGTGLLLPTVLISPPRNQGAMLCYRMTFPYQQALLG